MKQKVAKVNFNLNASEIDYEIQVKDINRKKQVIKNLERLDQELKEFYESVFSYLNQYCSSPEWGDPNEKNWVKSFPPKLQEHVNELRERIGDEIDKLNGNKNWKL